MNTVFSGFMEGSTYPYVIIDTGDIATTAEEGLAILDDIEPSTVLSSSTRTTTANGSSGQLESFSFHNPWSKESGVSKSLLTSVNDLGVVIHIGNRTAYVTSTLTYDSAYKKPPTAAVIGAAPLGALALNINANGIDIYSNTLTEDSYANSKMRYTSSFNTSSSNHMNTLYIQSHSDGTVFFFSTDPTLTYGIQKIGAKANHLNTIGTLEPQKIYCFRNFVVAASGTIYNAAGGTAPNSSVMAFNRKSGRLVGKSKSKADGSYLLQCIAKKGDELFIVCLDDDGVTPDFDAQIIDRVLV